MIFGYELSEFILATAALLLLVGIAIYFLKSR